MFYTGPQKLKQTPWFLTSSVSSRIRKHSLHSCLMVPEQMLFLFYFEAYHIVVILKFFLLKLISHTSKVMLKILQGRIQQYVKRELPAVQVGFKKTEEPEIKLPTSVGSLKKQETSRKTSTSALLTTSKLLTMWITTNCGIFFKRWNNRPPDLPLKKSYAGQEATVRTGHGTKDGFKVGKGVC